MARRAAFELTARVDLLRVRLCLATRASRETGDGTPRMC